MFDQSALTDERRDPNAGSVPGKRGTASGLDGTTESILTWSSLLQIEGSLSVTRQWSLGDGTAFGDGPHV